MVSLMHNDSSMLSLKRLAANQRIFESMNKGHLSWFGKYQKFASDEAGQQTSLDTSSPDSSFVCECSDVNCTKHLTLSHHEYKRIHKDNDSFVVAPGHDLPEIEDVTRRTKEFWVVKKHSYLLET